MADINMDNVNIEIQSSSKKASDGVNQLIGILNGLNQALGGIQNNLNKYIDGMKKISDISKNVKMPSVSSNIPTPNVASELKYLNSNSNKINLPTPKGSDYKNVGKEIDTLKVKTNSLGEITNKIGNRISGMFSTIAKTKIARGGIKALESSFGKLFSKISGAKDKIVSTIKSFSKYAFALYGIRSAFYAVRNVTNEFLNSQDAVAQQLKANISYLKFSLGSMFAPVIEYLTNLMFKLLQLVQYLVYYFTKINIFAGRSAKSYAAMGASAGKTTKELQKQLQAFDELNNINLENNAGSGGGGGGGIVPSVDLSEVKDFSGRILDAIKVGDWYGVGMEIGRKLNEALDKINWEKIKEKVKQIATNMADLMNGLVDGTDWKDLGSTIGEGINTAILFSETFFSRANFENLGKSLAKGINGIFYTVDWNGLGKFFINKLNAIIDTLFGFFKELDLKKIGESITKAIMSMISNIEWGKAAQTLLTGFKKIVEGISEVLKNLDWKVFTDAYIEFVSNIDWGEIVNVMFNLLGSAAAALVNLGQVLGNYIAKAFDGIEQFFTKEIEAAGGSIIDGVKSGIRKAVLGIAIWITQNIFMPFINGFKNVFKIQSPSKVMEELGVYIIQGLLNGIASLVGNVTKIAMDIWNNFTNTLSGLANWVNTKIIQPITKGFSNLINPIIEDSKKIYTGFTNGISNIFNYVNSKVVQPIVNSFQDLWNKLSEIFNNIRNAIANTLSNINIKIKTPHFSWGTQPASGTIANILSALNLPTSLPKLKIDWYAEGGYPNEGDLFFANEKGNPEMIGRMGNKTAVANNDQISKAIAQAAYEAMSRALSENQDSDQPIIVNVGNETLYKSILKSRSQASNQYGISM